MRISIAMPLRASGLVLFLLCGLTLAPSASAATLGPTLVDRLGTAQPGEVLEVIVTFHGEQPLSQAQLARLREVGVSGRYFQRLPMAGVLATPAQVRRIAALPEVRSVWFNDRLEYEMDEARTLTSVDQLKANGQLRTPDGLPYTGKGISILVNDSGVDGTHPDLLFGTKVIQNVLGHTDPLGIGADEGLSPLLPTENVPHTDVAGSHGTHVAGIAAGLGTMSDGRYAGAAIGASIVGFGSGAAISILNTAGGFDYALAHHETYNIRIITNSFGGPSTIGQPFDPNHPTNVASKMLADAGVITVFSAGNSGSGPDTITGPYKKAPWVMLAGNGVKSGSLAPSSSRGRIAGGVYEVEVGGEILTVEDRPTVVAPGTSIAAPRALVTVDPTGNLGAQNEFETLGPEHAPFYSIKTGTSMAAPHLAGLIAILLEANPALGWREVKHILKSTATNMSGYEPWEVGAGFANIEAAVAMALAMRHDYGLTNNLMRPDGFNANATVVESPEVRTFAIPFMPAPAGQTGFREFDIAPDVAVVTARFAQPTGSLCTCAVVLIDPDGNRFGSGIAQPVLAPIVSAAAPGKPGRWKVTMRGIGSVSGVAVDPLGLTNGVAGPATATVTVKTYVTQGFTGLNGIASHPLRGIIELAASNRLVDSLEGGNFQPDGKLLREQLAQYLVSGFGIRQRLDLTGAQVFRDISATLDVFTQAVTATGALLFDLNHHAGPAMLANRNGAVFNRKQAVTREQMAYSLVQVVGLQAAAEAFSGPLEAPFEGRRVPVVDEAKVDPALRGHVQLALDRGFLVPTFYVDYSNPLQPRTVARLDPTAAVKRAEYARSAVQANLFHLK